MKIRHLLSTAAVSILLMCSCAAPKNITYFQNNHPGNEIPLSEVQPIRLMPNDKVNIVVSTADPRLNALFNLPVSRNTIGAENYNSYYSGEMMPYTVDSRGDINFPVLGKLHIEGMTREELAEYIRRELISRELAKDPVVTVEFLNLAVSVMGEVQRPGRINLSREDFTILDALSQAGDLTIYGVRDNVKVLREENGVQKTYVVDLNAGDKLAQSPVYFLKQNDIIYVEPNDTRKRISTPNGNVWSTPGTWISILSSAISVATLVVTLTRK